MTELTIASHLASRLQQRGVKRGFGIVGDYALRLFADMEEVGFPFLVTADEQGAAFAADAYARLKGLGVVAVTYGVGGLKITNAVAGAWAEQVPLLVISGAPGLKERVGDVLLHHKIRNFDSQLVVFEELTCAQAVIDNPATAADEIDRVITEVLSHQRPGYLEIPRDMVEVAISPPQHEHLRSHMPPVDDERLRAAVADAMECLRDSATPVVHAGAMVWRRGLGDALVGAAERLQVPVATSSLAKGLFPERHPLSLGVYMGAVSDADVVERVETASTVVSFGVLNTDLTMGAFTAHLDPHRHIDAQDNEVTIGLRTYKDVPLWAFLPALAEAASGQGEVVTEALHHRPGFDPEDSAPLSVARVIAAVDAHMDDRHGLLVDPGECLFASVDLSAPRWCLASAYYATMGYAVPGALGAGIAEPGVRPVVLVGDGAFAMTGLEAASAAFHGIHPVILVLDNNGYGTQGPMKDGAFNDIPPLRAEALPAVFGTGRGWLATTEGELDTALTDAMASDELCIIRALVPKADRSPALLRLTDALGKRV
ncbi:MAG: alpha-keto acid decarboxylase family protein [Candidatus Nanopelagicales bacterium]